MAPPRKPSNVLELRGTFKRNPQRRRKPLKAAEGPFGNPPDGFDEVQRACWLEILDLAPPDVLKRSDRFAVEFLASLLAEFRQARYAFPAPKIAHMRLLLATFGMTPASREGFGLVSLADSQAPGRFSEFT
jgi:hypothetical protein